MTESKNWVTSQESSGQNAALVLDREDLLAVLELRFGKVENEVKAQIALMDDAGVLQRLILVAANVADWDSFLVELKAGKEAFRIE
ncbi:hypothetical protein D2Q93_11820 [Alicyclobacillaceae bacterium I2511]|nr:hypothetical protein D2Q93_11820 [Alicyclobacillaceae bacterium I2511]